MEKVRIAVFVSGNGTNLRAIKKAEEEGKIPHGEIALVLSDNERAGALSFASSCGIRTAYVNKRSGNFSGIILEVLKENDIQMIVLAGFLSILPSEIIKEYPERIINVHPSLIPSFCGKGFYGLRVHEAALSRGVKVTGATVHYVNEIPDGGKIIAQRAVYIEEGDTPEILQRRVMEQAEWIILPEVCERVAEKIYGEIR